METEFDQFVNRTAAELDAGPHAMRAAGPSRGSVFSDIMAQIRAGAGGSIPWLKLIVIASVVISDINAGKDIATIVADVLAELAAGKI